jgi:hypothetical protein
MGKLNGSLYSSVFEVPKFRNGSSDSSMRVSYLSALSAKQHLKGSMTRKFLPLVQKLTTDKNEKKNRNFIGSLSNTEKLDIKQTTTH